MGPSKEKVGTDQSMIRKLTTDKAIKAQKAVAADEVTEIRLSGRGIKTIESLDLPSLRRLDLSKNHLNRLKGLQGCPQVTYLTAAGNELTGEGLDGVRPLRDLKVFNASHNHVRRIPPSAFAQFRKLQALVLNNNEITEVPPSWLKKGLLDLNTFVLSHNRLKSLSASGLGRLTALTKLSVSYNMLSELPDLSSCSGLEELRAAHNRISQVPATLAENTSLRTLDMGHNDIDDWIGLERAGKTLTVLVQLTLAGNPLCGVEHLAPSADGGAEDAESAGKMAEEYIAKVRSLFPGLKVRDGKRVLMKKSHTYYQQRAGGVDAASDPNKSPAPPPQQKKNKKRKSPAKQGSDLNSESNPDSARCSDAEGVAVSDGAVAGGPQREDARRSSTDADLSLDKKDSRECSGKTRVNSKGQQVKHGKAERRLKSKKKAVGAAGKGNEGVEEMHDTGTGSTRGNAGGRETTGSQDEVRSSSRMEAKKKRRRLNEESAAESSSGISGGEKTPQLRPKEVAIVDGRGDDEKPDRKKPSKRSKKVVREEERKSSAEVADEQDPYSSSEELPIPGRKAGQGRATAASQSMGNGKESAVSSAGDAASGVKGIVVHRKQKGSKAKIFKKTGVQGVTPDHGERGGFTVDAMLEARGLRETLGLGSGVSAWD